MKKQKGKIGKIVNIEDWSFERFKKLLIEAEHCDAMMIRIVAESGIERWQNDCERLVQLTDFVREQAYMAHFRGDSDLTGTWLQINEQICDCAKEHLSVEGYHKYLEDSGTYYASTGEEFLEMIRFQCK